MDLHAETVLAAIGLKSILAAKPRKWSATVEEEAAAIPKKIRAHLSKFLTGRPEAADMPAFEFDEVAKLLKPPDEDAPSGPTQAAALVQAIPDHELAQDVAATATLIVNALREKLPLRTRMTWPFGDVPDPPLPLDEASFRRAWLVATDPTSVARDLAEGSLTTDMAQALAAFYPQIYQYTTATLTELAIAMRGKRPNFELDADRDRLARVLLQMEDELPLAADVQAMYAQGGGQPAAPAREKAKVSRLKLDPADLQTPGQKQ
jgi:hypothetical protein